MEGPKADPPDLGPNNCARGSDLDELPLLWPRLWPRSRCSGSGRDPAERVGTPTIGSAANVGATATEALVELRAWSSAFRSKVRRVELFGFAMDGAHTRHLSWTRADSRTNPRECDNAKAELGLIWAEIFRNWAGYRQISAGAAPRPGSGAAGGAARGERGGNLGDHARPALALAACGFSGG